MTYRLILITVCLAAMIFPGCSGKPEKIAEAAKIDPKVESFFSAVKRHDTEEVLRLLKGGLDVEVKNEHGNTSLMEAVLNRDKDMAGLLLSEGADAKAAGAAGETVLSAAVKWGDLTLLGLIIDSIPERERDINAAIVRLLLDNLKALEEKEPVVIVRQVPQPAPQGTGKSPAPLSARGSGKTEPAVSEDVKKEILADVGRDRDEKLSVLEERADETIETLRADLRREILAEVEVMAGQLKTLLQEEAAKAEPVELLRLTDIIKDR